MTEPNAASWRDLSRSAWLGALRGFAGTSVLFPLSVIKIEMQNRGTSAKVGRIAAEYWQKGGVRAFYRNGFLTQLVSRTVKQLWIWPAMEGLPKLVRRDSGLLAHDIGRQSATAFTISTLELAIQPFSYVRTQTVVHGTGPMDLVRQVGLREFARGSVVSMPPGWFSQSIFWNVFLISQFQLRRTWKQVTGREKLNALDTVAVGTAVSTAVVAAGAPTDTLVTICQARRVGFWEGLKVIRRQGGLRHVMARAFTGGRLQWLMLVVNNVFSVALLEHLGQGE